MNASIITYAFKEDRIYDRSTSGGGQDDWLPWYWTWIRFSTSATDPSRRQGRWSSGSQAGYTDSVSLCSDGSYK